MAVPMLHVRITTAVRDRLRAIADYHHRSQANTIEWLIAEEYRRLLKSGELQEPEQERTP